MKKYTTYENANGDLIVCLEDEQGVKYHIPSDPANSDYQRYLRWLENPDAEEGGTL